MTQKHTVRAYDQELQELRTIVNQMGGMVEAQIEAAAAAMMARDSEAAAKVVAGDKAIDAMEAEAEKAAIRLIALRAPMADDLREIIAAMKIASILERTADYAKNIAKRSTVLAQSDPVEPIGILPQMTQMARGMLHDVLDAFVERDATKAIAVRERDQSVDDLYNSLFRALLTYMVENPRTITPATHLLFIAKNLERIGDHATNIAELVFYSSTGRTMDPDRPKQDDTPFANPKPPSQ